MTNVFLSRKLNGTEVGKGWSSEKYHSHLFTSCERTFHIVKVIFLRPSQSKFPTIISNL